MSDDARLMPWWVRWSWVDRFPSRDAALANQRQLVRSVVGMGALAAVFSTYYCAILAKHVSLLWAILAAVAVMGGVALMGAAVLWQGLAIRWVDRERQWGRAGPGSAPGRPPQG